MKHEKSYGIVPLRRIENSWEVLLVQHSRALFWGYPKGHAENNETPLDTAQRELKEETNLEIKRLLKDTPFEEHYFFTRHSEKISKKVFLFLAEVTGTLKLQAEEISDSQWIPLTEASSLITYPTDKHTLQEVMRFLVEVPQK